MTSVLTLVRILVIAYLPGALLYRLPFARRELRMRLPAEVRAFWAVMLSVVISSCVALALAALGQYSIQRLLIADAGVGLGAVALAGRRLRMPSAAAVPRPTWTALLPVAVILLGAYLYTPTAEYVIGGKDPGTYMNEGIQIAQRGSLTIVDPLIAAVPPATRDLFFPSHDNPTYYGTRFMGFFILDPAAGTVAGQFPHLFPVWIAIGYGLGGLTGARETIAWWSVLALVAVYMTGRRLAGPTAAAVGTLLLAINVAQIWFARYPNAEMPMAALMLAGLLAYTRAHTDGDRFFAPVAGVLLALLLFLRFDAVLALAAVSAAALLAMPYGRWLDPWFAVSGALGLGIAALYLTTTLTPYMELPLIFLTNLSVWHVLGLVVGGAGVAGVAAFARRSRTLADSARRWIPRGLAAGLVGLAVYAYFFRAAAGRLAEHDASALRTFAAYYVTTPGLAAAVVGLAMMVRRSYWRAPAIFLTTLVFAGFFFYKVRIVPDHFWMARRFVPIILPMTLLSISTLAFWSLSRPAAEGGEHVRAGHPVTLVLPIIFVTVLGGHYVRASGPILHHVEYAGLIPRVERLSERFANDDLVIVESRNASDTHVLALPLAYIYARNVLVLDSPRPDKAQFLEFLTWARAGYGDVYFVGGGGTDLLSRAIGVVPVASERFQIPEYESARNAYPTGVRRKEFDFGIYRFTDPDLSAEPFQLDVGTLDDLEVVRLHAKEQTGDITFRWTRDVSYVEMLGLQADDRSVTLWLNDGGRPPDVTRAQVRVTLQGVPLGTVVATDEFQPYTFEIPPGLAAASATDPDPARLMLQTNTWNPRVDSGFGDDRDLGVMLDRVEVR
jgi:hypothetical protein